MRTVLFSMFMMLPVSAFASPPFVYDSRNNPECSDVAASPNLLFGASRPWRGTSQVTSFTCDDNRISIDRSESYLHVEYQGPWAPDMNLDFEGTCSITFGNGKKVEIQYKFHLGCT